MINTFEIVHERIKNYILTSDDTTLAEWVDNVLFIISESICPVEKYGVLALKEAQFSLLIKHNKGLHFATRFNKIYLKDIPAFWIEFIQNQEIEQIEAYQTPLTWLLSSPAELILLLPLCTHQEEILFVLITYEPSPPKNALKDLQLLWQSVRHYLKNPIKRVYQIQHHSNELDQLTKQLSALETSQKAIHENAMNFLRVHKILTDSLQYAQKMQKAILPSDRILRDNFEEYFVVFQPRDIVSGDFYWITQIDYTFIAVVDCTGHGVPGAFMSMIGNTLLNEIINIKRTQEPAKILTLLHTGIRHALNQDETQNIDGMDIGLCRLGRNDNFKLELTFSGAKNNLYLLQKDGIKVLKGNRLHIGGIVDTDLTFDNQHISLEDGDVIYMFTDGLIDNPNPQRQKFGLRQWLTFIEDYKNIPLQEQAIILQEHIKKHQGQAKQRDDITVLALKP